MILVEKLRIKVKKYLTKLELSRFSKYNHFFEAKTGLEIGGPSTIFAAKQILPVYNVAEQIDGVNFSTNTIWENTIKAGRTYAYSPAKLGYQYISEASDLSAIQNECYDFILSSHSLEHCANPIKALLEWKRVVRKGGVILVAVPDKRVTFDRKRSITSFEHLMDDYSKNVEEDDQTHLEEILKLHDITRDPGVNSFEQFKIRSMSNFENRCLHQHIFDHDLLEKIFAYLEMQVVYKDSFLPSIIILAKKQ